MFATKVVKESVLIITDFKTSSSYLFVLAVDAELVLQEDKNQIEERRKKAAILIQ